MTMRTSLLLLVVLGFFGTGCAAPRATNYYSTDLNGKMVYAEGNDTILVSSVKVSIAEVREEETGRVHVLLFENVTLDEISVDYRVRWLDGLGVGATNYSEWKSAVLEGRSERLELINQPDQAGLAKLEVSVRPTED